MLSIKIDRSLKDQARKTAKALGVSLNAVINQHIKEFINTREIFFTEYKMPNTKTQRLLKRIEKDIKDGKNIVGPFDSVDEFIKSLEKK
jgi:addiction module RelB/DinJ family antitoxin